MRPVGTYYLSMKQGSLRMFGATEWKLLNHFLNEKSKENIFKKPYWKLGMFLVLLESPLTSQI